MVQASGHLFFGRVHFGRVKVKKAIMRLRLPKSTGRPRRTSTTDDRGILKKPVQQIRNSHRVRFGSFNSFQIFILRLPSTLQG